MILDAIQEKLAKEGIAFNRVDGRIEIPVAGKVPDCESLAGVAGADPKLVITDASTPERVDWVKFSMTGEIAEPDAEKVEFADHVSRGKVVIEGGKVVSSVEFMPDGVVEAMDAEHIEILVRGLTCDLCHAAHGVDEGIGLLAMLLGSLG